MPITDYHAQYFAHELMKRVASDGVEGLAGVGAGARIDLGSHPIRGGR